LPFSLLLFDSLAGPFIKQLTLIDVNHLSSIVCSFFARYEDPVLMLSHSSSNGAKLPKKTIRKVFLKNLGAGVRYLFGCCCAASGNWFMVIYHAAGEVVLWSDPSGSHTV
jgi:hypothetical protein